MLEIDQISYSFPTKSILDRVSFGVNQGEIVAILGPNGAGKSTLLKLIAGDIAPQNGRISFRGKEMFRHSILELAQKRAVLVQQSQIAMNFSVEEIVLMGRYPHFKGNPSQKDLAIVKKSMKKSSIDHMDQRVYTSLSGGEKQRANLSRALAQIWEGMEKEQGKLLLLDEPLNNLDIEHQHQALEIAREFVKAGNSAIVVLHDLNMAARFADRLLLLSDAKLFAYGSSEEVLTSENIQQVFHYPAEVCKHPFLECLMVYYGCCRKTSGPSKSAKSINNHYKTHTYYGNNHHA